MKHPQPILVNVADLLPNPFRDLKEFPLSEERLQQCLSNIESSHFWNCMYGREHGKKIQIAFGHHRVEVARKLGIKKIYMTVMPLTDGQMLDYMARENIGNNNAGSFINEIVLRTKKEWTDAIAKYPVYKDFCMADFCQVEKIKEVFPNERSFRGAKGEGVGWGTLLKILPQPYYSHYKIETALATEQAIATSAAVDKKATRAIKTQGQQIEFARAVKKGKPLTAQAQMGIAKTINQEGVGLRNVQKKVEELRPAKTRVKTQPKPKPVLDDYVKETAGKMEDLQIRLRRIKGNEANIQSGVIKRGYFLSAENLHDVLCDILPKNRS